MKILLLGGMHGNEPLGPEIIELFRAKPVDRVSVEVANPKALAANSRYTEEDLNRSFPGDSRSAVYEKRRAAELMKSSEGYDVVFDFHNTTCPGNDCTFVGETASPRLQAISSWLGLTRVVVADYDCINKYVPTCISIEISLQSKLMDAAWWYEKIAELAGLTDVPNAKNVVQYRFVYRLTLEDKERLGLADVPLRAFFAMPRGVASKLGLASPAYPIFIADTYTPYNYGGVLRKIDV